MVQCFFGFVEAFYIFCCVPWMKNRCNKRFGQKSIKMGVILVLTGCTYSDW